ncbi:MAG: branched-chain amino acid ABC transporter permease [Betaproteobacteria bacterium]|nr:branched-chain amino acid ABC transporter permease [Betaproteobacteria bacterium]
MNALLSQLSHRALVLLALLVAGLLVLPLFANPYILSVAILALYFAFAGQAWNVMMGFCGQLSLGHSLYVGVGGYAAAALFVHFGVPPWIGVWAAVALCMAMGAAIGFLAFRFEIGGVYFALLTIAFAEFTRIGFDHFQWVGGSGGFFLPVAQRQFNDVLALRGSPAMFYYLMLAMTALALAFCAWLLQTRVGYYWQAIREDQEAAQSLGINTFRYKMLAVLISSGMTALSGVFFAFYYNNLFPEQIFNMGRSIEIILGPIIGGIGTLFGPILGAAVLAVLADGITELLAILGFEMPGIKQVFYGLCMLLAVVFLPSGIWPAAARRLGLERRDDGAPHG